MIGLEAAEAARVQSEDLLESLGAHAIEIQPVAGGGYELIAHFAEEPPATLPRSVAITVGAERLHVPLRARRSEPD